MDDLRKTKIKGNDYVEVSERVKAYWILYPKGRIETELLFFDHDKGFCVFKATVYDNNGKPKGNGHTHEYQADKSSMVNRTSYLENGETSAIGRAMAEAGILIEYGMASKEEVDAAKKKAKQMDQMEVKKSKPAPKDEPEVHNYIPQPEPETLPPEDDEPKAKVTEQLITMNAKAMKIKSWEDGQALRSEYKELVSSVGGKENLPSSIRDMFLETINGFFQSHTKEKMAAA